MKLSKTILILFICLILFILNIEILSAKTLSVNVSGNDIHYNLSGSGQVKIIFLHGLFADKSHWDKITEFFDGKEFTCVAPDLPCYGQSNSFPVFDSSLENQMLILHEFIKKISLNKINLAGNSLGGMLAIAYALKFPESVSSVCLIGAPAGFFPWSDDMMKRFNTDVNPFIPLSLEDFNFEMKCLFFKPPVLPEDSVAKAVEAYTQNKSKYTSIFNIVSISIYNFSTTPLPEFKCPVMMLLGQEEDVFNTKNVKNILASRLPACNLQVIPDAGHLVMFELPDKVTTLYIKFLKNTIHAQ